MGSLHRNKVRNCSGQRCNIVCKYIQGLICQNNGVNLRSAEGYITFDLIKNRARASSHIVESCLQILLRIIYNSRRPNPKNEIIKSSFIRAATNFFFLLFL